jgi:hypothetical protein
MFCRYVFALRCSCLTSFDLDLSFLILQYDVYNSLLRRHPEKKFSDFERGGNLFSTTIAVLSSAVQKISRVACIPEGTRFYRGLDRMMELPDSFFRPDEQGRRGFAEWGFLSTTQEMKVALKYSGVKLDGDGRPMPKVMVMEASAVDRGASVQVFSQYPKVNIHHVPP